MTAAAPELPEELNSKFQSVATRTRCRPEIVTRTVGPAAIVAGVLLAIPKLGQ